jgi:hypothetical protein
MKKLRLPKTVVFLSVWIASEDRSESGKDYQK